MCGIAGMMTFGSRDADVGDMRRVVASMTSALAHRGPDGSAVEVVHSEPAIAVFGHTRLAILDLTAAARQPMFDTHRDCCITYNGELVNFRELRAQLPEPAGGWRSSSDTEVVLQAYAHWGPDALDRLRGMFALAIWDAKKAELFMARDRFGIKPLYYYRGEHAFMFASELRALLASGLVPRRLDPVALDQYLAYQCVPAPRTLVQGVSVLAPGTWLSVRSDGSSKERQYWDLLTNRAPDVCSASREAAVRRVSELLREAVSSHLVSDVPVGIFLSGGIDSSAIAALVREAGDTPRTFTVALAERDHDESAYARCVAAHLAADHSELLVDERGVIDRVPEALAAQDHPSGDGVNTYLVAREVRAAGIKVALSGLGADELFGGYPSFERLTSIAPFLDAWRHVPASLRSSIAGTVKAIGGSSISATKTAALLAGDGTVAVSYPVMRQVLGADQRRALFEPAWNEKVAFEPDPYLTLLAEAFATETSGTAAQVAYAEARTYMHDLLLGDTDQMAMAHGLEVRVPFLDHPLAEHVMGLSDAVRWPNGSGKQLLIDCVKDLLPPAILHRPKQGFVLPFDRWMRGPLREFCETRLSPDRLGGRDVFRPAAVERLWRAFLAGRPQVSWSRIWTLVSLEEWLTRNAVS